MKILTATLGLLLFGSAFSQKRISPMLENVSRADIAMVTPLTPNRKIILTQLCSTDLPDTVVNGIVQFSNLRVKEDKVVASIEFKDTVVQKLIFYFDMGDKDALAYFGVPSDGFIQLGKRRLYQSYSFNGFDYACLVDRQKVTLIKTQMKIE